MTTAFEDDTERLLTRFATGDNRAATSLLDRHRARLKTLINLRLDVRLSSRVDASDVVQEAMIDAHRQLLEYANERPLPFYPWLRQVTLSRLAQIHRFHLQSQRRAVHRESQSLAVLDQSAAELAKQFDGRTKSPSEIASRNERLTQLENAIAELSESDREVLVLRYVEQLSSAEAAAVLGVTSNAFSQKHLRAVKRLRSVVARSELS